MPEGQQPSGQGRGRGKKLAGSPLLKFCLRLAHDLGKTLGEIGGVGIDELALWMAWYDKHDPELAKDWRSGVVASTVANANPWRKGKPRGPVDFFPGLARLAEEQNEADAERQLMAWCANVGGAVKVQKQESRK